MEVLILAEVRAAEGGLQRIAIYDAELFPANDSRRRFLTLLYSKSAVDEVEDIRGLFQQEWVDAFLSLCVALVAITIHEHVFLP